MSDKNTPANNDSDADQVLQSLLPPVVRRDEDRAEAPRTRRTTNLGGARMKLAVFGQVKGHHLYWCNDEDAAVEQLLAEGFSFVKPAEVNMQSIGVVQDGDITDRLSKYVGTTANGGPLRAYLLKCPQAIWDDIQAASQDQANAWDSAILAGAVGAVDSRYKPKGADISIGRVTSR